MLIGLWVHLWVNDFVELNWRVCTVYWLCILFITSVQHTDTEPLSRELSRQCKSQAASQTANDCFTAYYEACLTFLQGSLAKVNYFIATLFYCPVARGTILVILAPHASYCIL
jgi:hypothetical protein